MTNLYDPKFVHFEWSEDLKGKRGFFASDIGTIKKELHYKGPCMMGTLLHYSDNEARPFFVKFQGGTGEWRFFYYDPNFEIKWAYFKERKAIQRKCKRTVTWFDVGVGYDDVSFFEDDSYDYRIKPEEPKPEPKPNVEVNVDVKVNNTSSDGKIKITINGKECIFENAEQAKKVLFDGE